MRCRTSVIRVTPSEPLNPELSRANSEPDDCRRGFVQLQRARTTTPKNDRCRRKVRVIKAVHFINQISTENSPPKLLTGSRFCGILDKEAVRRLPSDTSPLVSPSLRRRVFGCAISVSVSSIPARNETAFLFRSGTAPPSLGGTQSHLAVPKLFAFIPFPLRLSRPRTGYRVCTDSGAFARLSL